MSNNEELKTMEHGKFDKLLDFLKISAQNDNAKALQNRLNILNVHNESSEEGNIVDDEDDDVEMIGAFPDENTQKEDENVQSYHYGMAIAKDIYELSEDLKIDAKIEIMQVIGKYQKRQLHRTTQH